MSLLGALNLGQASLAAQQAGLQVTGNNIANAGTPGYTRQTAHITAQPAQQIAPNIYLGTGAVVTSIERQINEALEASLRDATSDQSFAAAAHDTLARIESTFNALGDNDLSARVSAFFNSFQTLSQNPQDMGQRSLVLQNGAALASYLQGLRSQFLGVRDDVQAQIGQEAQQANNLAGQIAALNGEIARAEAGGGMANTLRDQRDAALTSLAQIMNVRAVDQGNGMVNVLVGSAALVQGTVSRGVMTKQATDPASNLATTVLAFADNSDTLAVTSGTAAGLIGVRDGQLATALSTLNTFANSLITTVNSIHSQGQGLDGFSTVTGTTQVLDPAAALSAAASATGLPSTPVNGTFNLHLKDAATGAITTRQISVNLSGLGAQTTLSSLATALTSGPIAASVDSSGHLAIRSASPNTTFTFSDDNTGVLAALGLNSFFTGSDASNIGVNATLVSSPNLLAAARDNLPSSNKNALALALGYTAASSDLGGQSLKDFYANYIGTLASQTSAASQEATAQNSIHATLSAQREAYSGVSLDEEAINLTKYQRAFQGSARYISVVDQMLQEVLGLIK